MTSKREGAVVRPLYTLGQFWCPRCERRDQLSVGYSWWCERCQIGGTQTEISEAILERDDANSYATSVLVENADHKHEWDFDPWEYGGATCKTCGLRDNNEEGKR